MLGEELQCAVTHLKSAKVGRVIVLGKVSILCILRAPESCVDPCSSAVTVDMTLFISSFGGELCAMHAGLFMIFLWCPRCGGAWCEDSPT